MVTIYDIAKHAGVHASTVSRALGGKNGVSADTRARVLKAAAELNFHPAGVFTRSLALTGGAVGVFMRQLHHPRAVGQFYTSVLQGIKQELAKNGLSLVLEDIPSDDGDESIARCTAEKKFVGTILVGAVSNSQLESLKSTDTPTVVVDQHAPGFDFDFVLQDDLGGARAATRLLIDKGHTRIGFVYAFEWVSSIMGRLAGYRLAMAERLGCVSDSLLWYTESLDIPNGESIAGEILASPERPTAMVVANDELAIGVMARFTEAGLRIPEDIAVVGFDDITWAAYSNPPLATVRVDKEKMGRLAVQRLLSRISIKDHIPFVTVVPTELVVRASAG